MQKGIEVWKTKEYLEIGIIGMYRVSTGVQRPRKQESGYKDPVRHFTKFVPNHILI